MNRLAVILNPKSGAWKRYPECSTPGGHEQLIRTWFSGLGVDELSVRETRRSRDGAEQAQIAHSQGFSTIVAAGGDGTIREIIQGIYELDNVRLGILPVGTANVFARSFKIPLSNREAAARVISTGNEQCIDLGISNSFVFALHAGIGLDGAVVRTTSPRLKRRLGRLAYVANSVRMAMKTGRNRILVAIDGEDPISYDAYQVLVANIPEYGGNMRLGDHVVATDGLLDLVICKRRGSTVLSALLDGVALATNRLTFQRNIEYRQVRSVKIESARRLDVQVDGDSSGTTPAEINVLPKALTVIVP